MQRGVIAACIHVQLTVDLNLTGGNFATAPGIQITIVCDGVSIIGVTVNLQLVAFGIKSPAVTIEAVIPIQQLGHIVAVDDEPYAVSKLICLAPAGIKRDNAILICRVCANNIISGSDKIPVAVFPAGEQIAVLAVAGNIFAANQHRRSEIFVIWRTGIEQIRIEIALAAIAVKQNGVVSINGLVDFTGSGCFAHLMKPLAVICPTNQLVWIAGRQCLTVRNVIPVHRIRFDIDRLVAIQCAVFALAPYSVELRILACVFGVKFAEARVVKGTRILFFTPAEQRVTLSGKDIILQIESAAPVTDGERLVPLIRAAVAVEHDGVHRAIIINDNVRSLHRQHREKHHEYQIQAEQPHFLTVHTDFLLLTHHFYQTTPTSNRSKALS